MSLKKAKKNNIKTADIKLKLFEALNVLYQIIKDKMPTPFSRTDFWAMRFMYIVIYRDDEKLASIKSRLERAQIKWGLQEYSDLYIKSAITEFSPETVKTLLNKITDNACPDLDYISYSNKRPMN